MRSSFRIGILILFIALTCTEVAGQFGQSKKGINRVRDHGKWSLQTNLMGHFSPFKNSFNLQVHYQLVDQLFVSVDPSIVYHSQPNAQFKGESYLGFELTTGPKLLLTSGPSIGFYYTYGSIKNQRFQEGLRQGGQYRQLLKLDRNIQKHGIGFEMGKRFILGAEGRLFLETTVGLSNLFVNVEFEELEDFEPLDVQVDLFDLDYALGRSRRVEPIFDVSIGYLFHSKKGHQELLGHVTF